MEERTKSILDKLPAKWFLAIVAVFGLIITVYTSFLKKDSPQLEYEVLSQISVFNRYDEVSSLRILLDTIDVQQNRANITFYTIKVINKGSVHINYDMYDKSNFGLAIEKGYMIKDPIVIEASNDYIHRRYKELSKSNNKFFLHVPYLPLDIDDYYVVRFGVYHENDSKPSFTCEGKISGQSQINIVDLSNVKNISFFKEAISGRWYIQLVRLLWYGILFLLIFISVLYIIVDLIPEAIAKQKRTNFVKNINDKNIAQKVKNDYIQKGERYIESLYKITSLGTVKLNDTYESSKSYVENSRNTNNRVQLMFHMDRIKAYDGFIKENYLVMQGTELKTDPYLKESIDSLYDLLKLNKLL